MQQQNFSGSLMLDLAGTTLTKEEANILVEPLVGGLILFTRNFESREQVCRLVADIRTCRKDLLISVDQEGGRVQRFRDGFVRLPPLQRIGELAAQNVTEAEDIAASFGWLMATDILSTGIDFSFAPVLDLDRDHCAVISDRSFSADPDECIALAAAYMSGMHEAGMAATAKHFPGHGGVRGDSHHELPIDSRTMSELIERDLRPFAELVDIYEGVMPGHLLFPEIDPDPVGFSSYWLQDVLRQKLKFDGVIFSDDLSMEGAASGGSYAARAELAFAAGCDMVLVCNNPSGAREVLDWMKKHSVSENSRVHTMQARRSWTRDQMLADVKYEKAHHYLDQIA